MMEREEELLIQIMAVVQADAMEVMETPTLEEEEEELSQQALMETHQKEVEVVEMVFN